MAQRYGDPLRGVPRTVPATGGLKDRAMKSEKPIRAMKAKRVEIPGYASDTIADPPVPEAGEAGEMRVKRRCVDPKELLEVSSLPCAYRLRILYCLMRLTLFCGMCRKVGMGVYLSHLCLLLLRRNRTPTI